VFGFFLEVLTAIIDIFLVGIILLIAQIVLRQMTDTSLVEI
jgi:hypothetical protein